MGRTSINCGLPIAIFDCQIVMMFVLPWQTIPIIVGFISVCIHPIPKKCDILSHSGESTMIPVSIVAM